MYWARTSLTTTWRRLLSLPVAVISIQFYRYKKRHGHHPDDNHFSRVSHAPPNIVEVCKA